MSQQGWVGACRRTSRSQYTEEDRGNPPWYIIAPTVLQSGHLASNNTGMQTRVQSTPVPCSHGFTRARSVGPFGIRRPGSLSLQRSTDHFPAPTQLVADKRAPDQVMLASAPYL